ncbi:hypothetical protein, partial [Xenorhabdus griffiniae]|uniref:hypothetical protein n=1 Tax=Xenorhabdus griffiniae TaxID=351672 RepID=UPI001D135A79
IYNRLNLFRYGISHIGILNYLKILGSLAVNSELTTDRNRKAPRVRGYKFIPTSQPEWFE